MDNNIIVPIINKRLAAILKLKNPRANLSLNFLIIGYNKIAKPK